MSKSNKVLKTQKNRGHKTKISNQFKEGFYTGLNCLRLTFEHNMEKGEMITKEEIIELINAIEEKHKNNISPKTNKEGIA